MSDRRTPDAKLIEAGIILARTYTRDDMAQSMLTRLATRLAELVEERRWVPVGKRLPEDEEWVDVAGDWGDFVGWYDSVGWHNLLDDPIPGEVTHWKKRTPGPETKESNDLPIQK
jgi:hypothetical protein